ncbi:DUF805 domain-containing protein [Piscinibacter sp. HJYY11]|uniref:DUF805 domain-containing protein n=1 Tax=Piscinibacter sp. HJYY11 TaxID=2801333 RepID=UPI00191D97C3|nr:DUF805 domain-containing protein [Piscinibacter sp. HJYY11]MBL0729502.1 DUF805 domain-containing protein [Piscinibacter sp. HJYY11]
MEGGQAQVRLVFAGELLEGHTLDEVKRLFGEMFKLDGDRLAAIFSGQRTVLKHQIGRDDGERYAARLKKLGMRVQVEPIDALPELKPLPAAVGATPAEAVKTVAASVPAAGLSLAELADEVECPNCGERQPKKFVLCRKCTTDIPRALASRAEDAERARAERLAARQQASGRFAPPGAEVDDGAVFSSDDAPPFWGFGFSGRLGRINYLLSFYASMLLFGLVGIGGAVLVPLTRSTFVAILLIPLMLAVVVWGLRATVLRFHDINRSGWWSLVFLLPALPMVSTITSGGESMPGTGAMTMYMVFSVINLLLTLVLLIYPGTHGDNDFGGPARQGNGFLAAILTLVAVLAFAAYVSFAMKTYNEYSRKAAARQATQSESDDARAPGANPSAAPAPQQQPMPGLPPGPAADAFRDQYMPASNEKAFAMSSAGAYGWAGGKSSMREAISAALTDCDQRRDAYTSQCRIVNVNGMVPKER